MIEAAAFWKAVEDNDLSTAQSLLRVDPALANRDFRPAEEQDRHTNRYPLVKASELVMSLDSDDEAFFLATYLLEEFANTEWARANGARVELPSHKSAVTPATTSVPTA